MAVVARMRVSEITLMGWATRVKLQPYMPAKDDPHYEEIQAFYEATPTGGFEATIKNALAAEQFQPGQDFYITLEPVPASAG